MKSTNKEATGFIPNKSMDRYEAEFNSLEAYLKEEKVDIVNESVLLAYFTEKLINYQCSSLWSKYSMIKKMLLLRSNIDISSYAKLKSFLKAKSMGHKPKKAFVLSKESIVKFLREAPDDIYLMKKVALIFGIFGACRREELTALSVHDIEDRGSVIVVTIPKTRTSAKRVFTIIDEDTVSALMLYRKYAALRPRNVGHSRFFLSYRQKQCTVMPVGKNTIGSIPKSVAKYLKLPNPDRYTGHTFRRTSATLLADPSEMVSLPRHEVWPGIAATSGPLRHRFEYINMVDVKHEYVYSSQASDDLVDEPDEYLAYCEKDVMEATSPSQLHFDDDDD